MFSVACVAFASHIRRKLRVSAPERGCLSYKYKAIQQLELNTDSETLQYVDVIRERNIVKEGLELHPTTPERCWQAAAIAVPAGTRVRSAFGNISGRLF